MATGDLKGSLRKVEHGLRLLNYPREVDYAGMVKGDPAAFLPIISYAFTSYSTCIADLLVASGVELIGKNDVRFLDAVYKLLRDQFQYKPVLTKHQFLQCGFAERKIQIVCDIMNSVMKKHKDLCNLNKVKSHPRKKGGSVKSDSQGNSEDRFADPVIVNIVGKIMTSEQKKAMVERHPGKEDNVELPSARAHSITEDDKESDMPGKEVIEGPCEQQDPEFSTLIAALQRGLAECQEKLDKLSRVEDKLHNLEAQLKGKVVIDEKAWNNLLSRVLLLETELLLQPKKNDPSIFNEGRKERTSIKNTDLTPSDRERKEEMPQNLHLQSSGYSSLLSPDPSPQTTPINYSGLTEVSEETTMQKVERIGKMIQETAELLKYSSNPS
ncbi:centrosomal protein of 44 kDa [Tachyglossus aculeatus]|uniref:centrosomal protein of 44 kDa n=1 Tax=Tachyglossus aculeatus TaxID=9261 RepID=UPI0018F7976B|nr:centrosomal protein of 44 kDa [Tachyglossus aculeatus]XP_038610907.1 centrosomal protein of 44 kDa [Tachyglossus aculeatus]XP_038610908.1 centrosomal protein of 44 kDa [Tachyglossus aculeatus]XP_038610909.1 centrosomal protein of 44 kDa [Tachyglossus aculeatus]